VKCSRLKNTILLGSSALVSSRELVRQTLRLAHELAVFSHGAEGAELCFDRDKEDPQVMIVR
jgi:hypothetical protein